jgi:hypothetical protein
VSRHLRAHPRATAAGAFALVLLVVLPFVGRWERSRNASRQNARMEAVYRTATVDGLDSPLLDRYRLDRTFDCLLYHPVGRPIDVAAYELCFDRVGRLVETIDRDTGNPTFGSLVEQPELATLRVPPHEILAALAAHRVMIGDPRMSGVSVDSPVLPTGFNDLGAFGFPPKPMPAPKP